MVNNEKTGSNPHGLTPMGLTCEIFDSVFSGCLSSRFRRLIAALVNRAITWGRSESFHLDDDFDFHRYIAWQGSHSYSRSGMASFVSKHFYKEVGASVDDLRMVGEVRC